MTSIACNKFLFSIILCRIYCKILINISKMAQLPLTRVKTIMGSSADVETVHKEAVLTLAKATEGFLKSLTDEVIQNARSAQTITYTHVSDVVHDDEKYEFLREIIPKKITVGEYKKLVQNQKMANGNLEDLPNRRKGYKS